MFSDADFSGSQYGGGYMQNESGMGNMVSPSPAKRKVVDQCLLPCTIKQILLAPEPKADENLSIDGRELSNVSIIGSILQIDVQSTHVTYRLDDGSGAIDVKVWSGDGDQSKQPQLEDLKLSSYIRVIGRVQAFKGKRSITGFALVPLLDMNELTLHFLECIYAHLYNTTSSKKLDFGNSNNNDVDMMDVSMKKTQISASRNNFSNNTMDTSVPEGSWSDLEKKKYLDLLINLI